MSDETKKDPGATDEATVTATEPVAAEPQEQAEPVKAFSQDEVNDILEKRLAKERRRIEKQVRDELASKPKPAEQPKPKALANAAASTDDSETKSMVLEIKAELEKERRDRQFNEFLADNGLKLNQTQKRLLRKEFDPNDHEAALDIVNDAGWVKSNAAPAKATNGPSVPTPQATADAKPPGYKSPGAPSGDPDTGTGADPSQWDADTVARKIEQGTFRSEMEAHLRKQGHGFNPFGQFRRRIPS